MGQEQLERTTRPNIIQKQCLIWALKTPSSRLVPAATAGAAAFGFTATRRVREKMQRTTTTT